MGGDTTTIETNYFGKGDTSTYNRATWPAVSTPQDTFHTYRVSWQKDAIIWYIDGNAVRTLNYADASGGTRFPQTPMRVRIGVWAGGDPSNGQGTIEWAGGETNYADVPFTMYVKSVEITNANPANSYTYSDHSGSYQSIEISGAAALKQTDSSTSSSSSSISSSIKSTSTGASTMMTATQSSTTSTSTAGSSSSSSSSSSSANSSGSPSSSSANSSGSSSNSSASTIGSSSTTEFGSGSSTTTESGSGSSTSSSTLATATFNAAANVAVNYLGPFSLLALASFFIQF